MVSTLLTGDEEQTVNVFRINAAFVNKSGQDVIIADGRYFVREESDSGTVWQTQNREWGHTQSDFEDPSEIDSAFKDESGRVYLFSNDQYIRYSTGIRLVDNGYPKNIADSWSSEGKNQLLPESFQSSINGAFHGEDDETYFFKGDKFIASDDFSSIRPTTEMWGKVKNNLAETQQVDAFYVDSNLLYLFSGDQIFAFRDSIENDGVLVQEGFPQTLADFFGTRLPGQFHNGVDAAFKGEDKLIHLFKGSESITIRPTAGNNSTPRAMEKLKDKWGIV